MKVIIFTAVRYCSILHGRVCVILKMMWDMTYQADVEVAVTNVVKTCSSKMKIILIIVIIKSNDSNGMTHTTKM